jgi:hypothetical protein
MLTHRGKGTHTRPFKKLQWVEVLHKGHCHLKEHLFKLELVNGPICKRCLEKEELVSHILCVCEAMAHLQFVTRICGSCIQVDCHNTPIRRVLLCIRSVGLRKG